MNLKEIFESFVDISNISEEEQKIKNTIERLLGLKNPMHFKDDDISNEQIEELIAFMRTSDLSKGPIIQFKQNVISLKPKKSINATFI